MLPQWTLFLLALFVIAFCVVLFGLLLWYVYSFDSLVYCGCYTTWHVSFYILCDVSVYVYICDDLRFCDVFCIRVVVFCSDRSYSHLWLCVKYLLDMSIHLSYKKKYMAFVDIFNRYLRQGYRRSLLSCPSLYISRQYYPVILFVNVGLGVGHHSLVSELSSKQNMINTEYKHILRYIQV